MMSCQELASSIERVHPDASPRDVARLCLLLSNMVDDLDELRNHDRLCSEWTRAGLRLQSITDQHAAMTAELEAMVRSNPTELSSDDVATLLRAIKVQSRALDMYVGHPTTA